MAHTIGTIGSHTSSAGNPITASVTVLPGETLLVVMLEVVGATNRAGGALTYGDKTLTQANTTQKAAASPDAQNMGWTFGTSDDWGVVAAAFYEVAPPNLQNYFGVDAESGISVTEKI